MFFIVFHLFMFVRAADFRLNLPVNSAPGEAPYFAQTRRSRRSTWATCEPKTPR